MLQLFRISLVLYLEYINNYLTLLNDVHLTTMSVCIKRHLLPHLIKRGINGRLVKLIFIAVVTRNDYV